MVMDHQPPIVRDFLGLGKLVTDDQELQAGTSINMDFRGLKHSVGNIDLSTERNFPFRKPSEETYMEGSAESHGLASARQWQGMVPGTNTTIGGSPARVLASDPYAKSNGMQLTILYGGLVNVYNNIHADKAQAIMHMAANGNLLSSNGSAPQLGVPHVLGAQGYCQPAGVAENFCFNAQTGPVQFAADQASQNCSAASKQFDGAIPNTPSSASSPQSAVPSALPLARKASLARFLEKRKERMQMMMPYFKKQLPPAQGEQMLGPFHGATLAKLFDEYYRRPSTMVFAMPEHLVPHSDMPSCAIPPRE